MRFQLLPHDRFTSTRPAALLSLTLAGFLALSVTLCPDALARKHKKDKEAQQEEVQPDEQQIESNDKDAEVTDEQKSIGDDAKIKMESKDSEAEQAETSSQPSAENSTEETVQAEVTKSDNESVEHEEGKVMDSITLTDEEDEKAAKKAAEAAAKQAKVEAEAKRKAAEKAAKDAAKNLKAAKPEAIDAAVNALSAGQKAFVQGNFSDAEKQYQGVINTVQNDPNQYHMLAQTLQALGNLQYFQGQYPQAAQTYERLVTLDEEKMGKNHRDTEAALKALGLVYTTQKQYDKAEPIYRRLVGLTEAQVGPLHQRTVKVVKPLLSLLILQDKYDEALTMATRVLQADQDMVNKNRNRLGESTITRQAIADDMSAIAQIQQKLGHWDEAERYYLRALAIYQYSQDAPFKTLPREALLAKTMQALADVHLQQNNPAQAEFMLLQSVAMLEKTYLNQPGTQYTDALGKSLIALGNFYVHQSQFDDARQRFGYALALYEKDMGKDDIRVGRVLTQMAQADRMDNKLSEAAKLEERAVQVLKLYGESLPKPATDTK